MNIFCCKCNELVKAYLTTGKEIYPHRRDLFNLMFYKCPKCGGYVGCHKGTTDPLGVIPTQELKRERIKIHNKMDVLWKKGQIRRKDLYKKISQRIGYEYHNGTTKTIEECKCVLKIINDIKKELESEE